MEHRKLRLAAFADIHMADETMHDQNYRLSRFKKGFTALRRDAPDVFVSAGDLTDHGHISHWETLCALFAEYAPCDRLVLTLGNHDLWSADADKNKPANYGETVYLRYRERISGCRAATPYFSETVKGIKIISLASEEDTAGMRISEAQLSWLDRELAGANAYAPRNPVFVIAHYPFNNTHGLPGCSDGGETDGIGEDSDAVRAVMRKYKNVFFISGHIHLGFNGRAAARRKGYSSFEEVDGIHALNLPCYSFLNQSGDPMWGYGGRFDVYDDRVELHVKNYLYPLPGYRYTIPLN